MRRGAGRLVGALLVAAILVAARPDAETATARVPIAAGSSSTADLLAAMAMLTGQEPSPEYVADWADKINSGTPIDAYIDDILKSKRFGGEIVPALVFGTFVNVRNYYALPSQFVLKENTDSGERIYYLRQPCSASDAVTVHPWWDVASEVKVCPDSYRPQKWTLTPGEHSYRSRMPLSCDSQVGSPELETKSLCGCGPNLIRCLKNTDQYTEMNRSLMDEVKLTTAYIVDNDLPIASVFTGNSTFRDRNVELYYRRQKIDIQQIENPERMLADLGRWPEGGQWAPREEVVPGEHAGVLTSPQILHSLPDRRQRQRGYYEIMWCAMRNSFGATTQKVLDLNLNGNLAFVHDSWSKLAHTELCTNCHARLDYGFQFFMGYPDSRASIHYNPSQQLHDQGPLYGRDIDDKRGTGPLTPLGFARIATAQPEFTGCMATHFVTYVLGDRATSDDRKAIEDAVEKTGHFKAVMKVALERYAERWHAEANAPGGPPTQVDPPAGAMAGTTITVGPALRKQLDTHCGDCHDKLQYTEQAEEQDDKPFDFTGHQLPRRLLVQMTDRVAFGMMPKDEPLDAGEREEVVTDLIDTLWSDPQARAEADRYYLGRARGLPAQQIDNVLYAIDKLAPAHSTIAWGALERGLWSDQSTITPGYLALTSLEALAACKQAADATGAPLVECLDRATTLQVLSRWPFH